MAYEGIYNRRIKRILDICIALPCFLILIPVYVVIGAAIAAETGFPVFYRPLRGGYQGKEFRIWKFRTMVQDADKKGGGTTALHDSRITKVGSFLRKTKLDETANLISILHGDMSFIGPRPELLKYTRQYRNEEKIILQVRPGITDYSSIAFINLDEIVGEEHADEIYEKVVLEKKNRLRIAYAKTVSLKTDMKLFFCTIGKVLQKSFRLIQAR